MTTYINGKTGVGLITNKKKLWNDTCQHFGNILWHNFLTLPPNQRAMLFSPIGWFFSYISSNRMVRTTQNIWKMVEIIDEENYTENSDECVDDNIYKEYE